MVGPGSKTSSFVSERFVVLILAGILIVLNEIVFFPHLGVNLGRGIGSSEM